MYHLTTLKMRSDQESNRARSNGVAATREQDTQCSPIKLEISSSFSTDDDDLFSDAKTYQRRLDQQNATSQESLAEIFASHTVISSQSQQDQFAAAIMRLQVDLSSTGERLSVIEGMIERLIQDQRRACQKESEKLSEQSRWMQMMASNSGWFHLAWPIAVYLLMRTFEKRFNRTRE